MCGLLEIGPGGGILIIEISKCYQKDSFFFFTLESQLLGICCQPLVQNEDDVMRRTARSVVHLAHLPSYNFYGVSGSTRTDGLQKGTVDVGLDWGEWGGE
jgi:hypothetical protein